MFYSLEPEVAGQLGDNSVLDTSTHPPIVHKLHYQLDGWLGDDILESFPCYIVTDRLRQVIESVIPTGCEFANLEVTKSQQFLELYPDRSVPTMWWLRPVGRPGRDDFGVSDEQCLVVSDRVYQAMSVGGQLDNCEAEPYEP